MPAEIDIQALTKRKAELEREFADAHAQYVELQKTDPMAALKLSEAYKPKRQLMAEFDDEIARKKQELAKEIESGDYLYKGVMMGREVKTDPDGRILNAKELGLFDPYQATEEYYKKRTEEVLGTLTGEKVKMDEGLPGSTRVYLSMFSPQKREQIMRQWYGDNAKSMTIGGQQFQMYKDGDTWKPVNPIGFQASDLAMIPAEIAPTLGAMGGAILGTGATGGPWGGAMGAAGGYAGVGTLQDKVMSSIAGLESTLAEDFGRRSFEGMLTIPLEGGGAGFLGKVVARRPAQLRSQQTFRDIVRAEEDYLSSRGVQLRASDLLEGGVEKASRRAEAAVRRPHTKLGRDFNEVVHRAQAFKDESLRGQRGDFLYQSGLQNLKHSAQQAEKMVALYNQRASDILQNVQRKKMEQLVPTYKEGAKDSIGQRLADAVTEAGSAAEKAKNEAYDTIFYPTANQAVGEIDPVQLAKTIEQGHYTEAARSSQVEAITRELRARPKNARRIARLQKKVDAGKLTPKNREIALKTIEELKAKSGPLDAKALDKLIRRLRKAHPETLVGGTEEQLAAGRAADAADAYRRQLYNDAGVLDLYDQATAKYDAFRQFDKGQLGGMLQDALGEAAKTRTQITNAMTSDPDIARKVLTAIRRQAPEAYQDSLLLTREAYLRKAGIQETQGMLPKKLKHDKDMVNALWGRDEFGNATPGAAQRMNAILDQLHKDFKTYNLDASKIKVADLDRLQNAFDPKQFKMLKKNIIDRTKNQEEAEKALATSLIKIAKQGHREAIQSHEFPRAMWKAGSSDLKTVLKQLDAKELEVLKGDYMEYFFSKYPPTGEYGPYGKSLWNGEQFLADIAENPNIKNNIRAVLGQDKLDEMVAYSTVMQAAKRPGIGSNASMGGAKVGEKKANIFLTADRFLQGFADRYHAAMYRANLLPVIGKRGKDVTAKEFDEEYQKALRLLFTTSAGIQALTLTGRHDPNWGGHLGEAFSNIPVVESFVPEDGIPGAKPMSEPSERRYK